MVERKYIVIANVGALIALGLIVILYLHAL
jgi:hypothetical protein